LWGGSRFSACGFRVLLSAIDLAASRTPITDLRVFCTAYAIGVNSNDQGEKCEAIFAKQDNLGEIPEIINSPTAMMFVQIALSPTEATR
jgi:hypothetical protein